MGQGVQSNLIHFSETKTHPPCPNSVWRMVTSGWKQAGGPQTDCCCLLAESCPTLLQPQGL